jgi:hypothetical protein
MAKKECTLKNTPKLMTDHLLLLLEHYYIFQKEREERERDRDKKGGRSRGREGKRGRERDFLNKEMRLIFGI